MLIYNFDGRIIFALLRSKGSIYNSRIFSALLAYSSLILINYFYLTNSGYNYFYKLFILYCSVRYYLWKSKKGSIRLIIYKELYNIKYN